MNLLYYYWRRHGDKKVLFIFWCLSAAWYSIYACTWDFLMDWSLLRVHDTRYPFLRQNLLYSNSVYVYYFALVSFSSYSMVSFLLEPQLTNLLLRFLWVVYIPIKGPSMMLRSFIVGILEMLRRVQWNFFRLENEHLGNMDQYRVTREVPLPYAIDETRRHEEDDEEDARIKRHL
ncbi:EXS family-domain-containing protein [Crepidotus variabilis]|uniref:EXS family-domain-containing protein n=1 Tax=Crepidotus variabilis TaxID=179855 RepID=A0A9P6EPM3_9AGAR|nr:EXS family-domain-containing protein [Crepidotus variabilis]